MDRQTRKANLKKLQLPSTSGNKQQRKTRQTAKATSATNTAITKYFLSPEKCNKDPVEEIKDKHDNSPIALQHEKPDEDIPQSSNIPVKPLSRNRTKRAKLDAFIFKDPNEIPERIKNVKKSLNEEDFIVPEKKAKKAPKLTLSSSQTKTSKSSRSRKQTTIKSAFLRNEQLFAEIAAQHCAADQFDGDDVQLALAISKSEALSNGIEVVNENEMEDEVNLVDGNKGAESIRKKLKKYGFRTADKTDYNNFAAAFLPKTNGRRPKSKWANKFTALTLRSPENQLKKLQDNIEKLLNSQFRTKCLIEQESLLPHYKLQSTLLKTTNVHENKRILQNVENINQTNDWYFVSKLFEINQLPAGHLLKDWTAIQGRDLTPSTKSKKSTEKLQKLQNIYQELEEYFSSRKRLDWSIDNEQVFEIQDNEEQKKQESIGQAEYKEKTAEPAKVEENRNEAEISASTCDKKFYKLLPCTISLDIMQVSSCSINTQATINSTQKQSQELPDPTTSTAVISDNATTNKLVEIVDLIEDMQRTKGEIKNSVTHCVATTCASNVPTLLQTSKPLDIKQVSSCSKNTQTTINVTQTPRSNSPDLFADSDVEMEECNREEGDKTKAKTVINVAKDKSRNSSIDEVEAAVTTYEIFSSDEVNNTSSSELNKSTIKEPSTTNIPLLNDDNIIDLTQEYLTLSLSPHNQSHHHCNQSKPIEEIDLFAESPLQQEDQDLADINSNSQISKYVQENQVVIFKSTLSMKKNENVENFIENKDDSFKLSLTLESQEKLKELSTNNELEDDDIVLREMALDQNTSFFNFQGSKQLETGFHKETAGKEKDIIADSLMANDTIFRELCNKYINETNNTSTSEDAQNTDFVNILPTIKTPEKCENYTNFTMDFDMTVDNNLILKRKSISFTAKTPLKMDTMTCNTVLAKSQSFNNSKVENDSIDLTQNEGEDNDIELAEDEDDECLVLSDDEINYSIWQANKTANFKTLEQSDHEDDVISILDNQVTSYDEKHGESKEQIIEFSAKNRSVKELSYLNLKDKEKSIIELQLEESYNEFEVLTSKYCATKTPPQDDLKFDRSDFGILEEYSEPIDFTPNLCTPTKVLNESSFLSSPSETTAPMTRYSNCHRSSQKFQDLINNIETNSPTYSTSDFYEFDLMAYTSPLKTVTSANTPQGIEQLLTAEISFKESQKSPHHHKAATIPVKTTEEITCNNKTYTLRYTSSPKPDYTKYSEAELLKQLYNFGIKPLKRKQAVKMLEYIYNQTHPILMDEDGVEKQTDYITMEELERPCTSKAASTSKSLLTKHCESLANIPHDIEKETVASLLDVVNKKLNLQDSCGLDMLRYGIDLKAELLDEQFILQTNVTKKTPQPLLPFHIAWYNLVCSNRKLHEAILMYEPIDLQEIYLFLKTLGYRYDPKVFIAKQFMDGNRTKAAFSVSQIAAKLAARNLWLPSPDIASEDLKIFFDRRCIIFRYDLKSAAGSNGKTKVTNRHVRKKNKNN